MLGINRKSLNGVKIGIGISIILLAIFLSVYIYIIIKYTPSPNFVNNSYISYTYPYTNILNILGVLIGSSLTSIITLILYNNTLNEESNKKEMRILDEKRKIMSNIEGIIAGNSVNAALILETIKIEEREVKPGYEYKIPLPDVFPFSQIIFNNITYFLEDKDSNIMGIAFDTEYLVKCLEFREDLILNHFDKDISSMIKEQDGYLIQHLTNHIRLIKKFEENYNDESGNDGNKS